MIPAKGTLGCASQYTVELHALRRTEGNEPAEAASMFYVGAFDNVGRIQWARILRDLSEAEIELDFLNASPECCRLFNQVEVSVSQIKIWRDNVQVWEGEVTQREEEFGNPVKFIRCQDVVGLLDNAVNTHRLYTTTKQNVTDIALNMLEINYNDPDFNAPLDPDLILAGIVQQPTEQDVINFRRGAVVDTLGNLLRSMAQSYGLDFWTINRSLFLSERRSAAETEGEPRPRLTIEDFDGGVSVVANGLETGTMGFATTQKEGDSEGDPDWPGITETYGDIGTRYGRKDVLRHVDDMNADEADVRRAARNAVQGRNPPPTEVRMPSSSRLMPTAPLTVQQLIPGSRIDVYIVEGMCGPIRQPMRITAVEVDWRSGGQEDVMLTTSTWSDVTAAEPALTATQTRPYAAPRSKWDRLRKARQRLTQAGKRLVRRRVEE